MTSARGLIRKMLEFVAAQRRDINQLGLVAQHSITDIYRAANYAAQVEGILKQIDSLLDVYEGLGRIQAPSDEERKRYAQTINGIATEVQLLKATLAAMGETTSKLKQAGRLEGTISGTIAALKKQVDKTLKKTEQLLNS